MGCLANKRRMMVIIDGVGKECHVESRLCSGRKKSYDSQVARMICLLRELR